MGVEVNTDRLWRRAADENLARLVFVNMLDRERADFFRALDSLKAAFGPHVVATEIPIGSEHEVTRRDRPDRHEGLRVPERRSAARRRRSRFPEELLEQAEEYREKLMDEVAENSDALMERYLEGEEISHEEMVTTLKKGVAEAHLFPVTCGIATQNLGTSRLLEALVEDLPSPAMRGALKATDEEGETVEVEPDEDADLVAYVFKTRADPFVGPDQHGPRLLRRADAPTRSSSTSPTAPRSGSASCSSPRARSPSRSTSSAPATSAPSRS